MDKQQARDNGGRTKFFLLCSFFNSQNHTQSIWKAYHKNTLFVLEKDVSCNITIEKQISRSLFVYSFIVVRVFLNLFPF